MRYDLHAIREIVSVPDVLARHGLPSPKRGPCPLCETSDASSAFAVDQRRFRCFACGAHGGCLDLEAALSRTGLRAAIAALAGVAGLGPADPGRIEAQALRSRRRRFWSEVAESSARIQWQARMSRLERLGVSIRQIPRDSPLARDVLASLYAQAGAIEAWLETREYPRGGWA